MKPVYVIAPLVLLGGFASYYVPASARLDAALAQRQAAAEQQRLAEERERDARRQADAKAEQARLDERRRIREEKERRAHEELERHDRALAQKLAEATTTHAALRAEIAALEGRAAALAHQRDALAGSVHVARTELEARRIERRNLDLELQRMTHLVADAIGATLPPDAAVFPPPRRE